MGVIWNRAYRTLRRLSLWDAVNTTPAGVLSKWVTLWSVGFMSFWVGWATWRIFGENPPEIGAGAAAAYATLIGTGLAGAYAFYRWARNDKDVPYYPPQGSGSGSSYRDDYTPTSRF